MSKHDAPEVIYLQVCPEDCDENFADHEGVTWCTERINDSDVKYVRNDIVKEVG